MTRRALVLGGGGLVGVAWETGLIEGLAEGGIDLREVDVIVGTSAGSLVGARLAAGQDLATLDSSSVLPTPPMAEGGVDVGVSMAVLEVWSAMRDVTPEACAAVGAHALRARTASEADWIAATGGGLGFDAWPDTALRISAVDAGKGERVLFDRDSGVPLAHAVAASCAVPGLFPTIAIQGVQYMDGGVWSGTHADALLDDPPNRVMLIAPLVEGVVVFGGALERALQAEVRALEAAGTATTCILPESADREAFGPDLMDPLRAPVVRDFARERGLRLARSAAISWD